MPSGKSSLDFARVTGLLPVDDELWSRGSSGGGTSFLGGIVMLLEWLMSLQKEAF